MLDKNPRTTSDGERRNAGKEVNKGAGSFSNARICVKLYFVKCPECLFICRLCPSYKALFSISFYDSFLF